MHERVNRCTGGSAGAPIENAVNYTTADIIRAKNPVVIMQHKVRGKIGGPGVGGVSYETGFLNPYLCSKGGGAGRDGAGRGGAGRGWAGRGGAGRGGAGQGGVVGL